MNSLQGKAHQPPRRLAGELERCCLSSYLCSDRVRDLIGSSAEEVAAERARVATEGAGARLLTLQAADGR